MSRFHRWVIACLTILAFLAPLKFGTPVILQSQLTPPQDWHEWLGIPLDYNVPWPNQLAVMFSLGALTWLVLDSQRMAARVDGLFVLPLIFLLTQMPAMADSINRQVSNNTVMHFAVCVLLFYAAAWYVRDGASTAAIFGGLALATLLVCIIAFQQYFGGLEDTRQFAALYPDRASLPEAYLARMTSNRVFGSFFYPNTLAGYIVVAFAPVIAWIWARARSWNALVKWLTLLIAAGLMVFCLVLTGSRGGFVAFVVSVAAGLWCLARGRSRHMMTVVAVGLALLAVVFVAAQRGGLIGVGTRSLEARTDYWRGALAIARDYPWWGTGPGTFGSIYPKYKTAKTEEAQLVHNNFLEMWCDSGVFAFVAFAALWLIALRDAFRLARQRQGDAAAVAICAGLTGWVIHSLVDLDLYVPGAVLPAFLLLGALQGLKELREISPVAPRGRRKWLIGAVCAVLIGAVLWTEGREVAAGFAHARAHEIGPRNAASALAEARRAAALAPYDGFYEMAAGDLAISLRKFDEAIRHFQRAIDNDPFRAAYHARLARAEMAAYGVSKEVLKQFRLAASLNPTNARYQQDLAEAEESVRQPSNDLLGSTPAKE
jgi:putative inorganic carbon (HCO3(-)) transporter